MAELKEQEQAQLQKKLKQLAKWRSEYEVAKDMMNHHKSELDEFMQNHELEIAESPEVTVKISTYTSNRFSSKDLKKDHPELYEQYRKASETRKINITLK